VSSSVIGSSAPWISLRITVAVVMGAPWIICLAMWFVLSGSLGDELPWTYLAAVLLIGVLVGLLIWLVGYRATALPTGMPPAVAAGRARSAYLVTVLLRLALAEIPLVVSMALAFLPPTGGFWVVLLGAVITLGLTLIHVWPTQRSVDRVSDSLERSGTRSHLRESLALPPR
jgi:hypothetical protein